MAENVISKVIYGNRTLIDLTGDTVTASDVINSKKFHNADGTIGTGTCTYDVDSSSATASVGEVLTGKTFAKDGSVLTGTMPNRGSQVGNISTKAGEVSIQQGYHDGSGKVTINATEQAKLIPGNIKNGVQILGVDGSYTGSELIKATTLSATSGIEAQTILPSDLGDYDYFTQVSIAAIPYSEVVNPSGGYTATIGVAS